MADVKTEVKDESVNQPKKGVIKMATATKVDVTALSFSELTKLMEQGAALLKDKRKSELDGIVQHFLGALTGAGFSKTDGLEALGVGVIGKSIVARPKGVNKPKAGKGPQPKWGATYKNPTTGETWTKSANGKGKVKGWVAELIAAGKTYEELEVK